MLPRVLRSRLVVGMEEEDVVEMAGCAARAERRVGEGIAVPNPDGSRYEYAGCTAVMRVALVTARISASRQECCDDGLAADGRVKADKL